MKPTSFIISMICMAIATIGVAQKKTPVTLNILPDNSGAVVCYRNGTAHVLSLPDLAVVKTLSPTVPEDRVGSASISPDGKRLVVFHDKSKKIVVWAIEAGSILFEVAQPYFYTFDPTGTQLICQVKATDSKTPVFNVYDLTDGKLMGPMQKMNNKHSLNHLSFSSDGSRLLGYSGSGLDNGELEVFDYKTGEKLCEKWMGEDTEIRSARFMSNDSIEVQFRYHMATTSQVGKFSVMEKEKEMKGSTELKYGGDFTFEYGTNRFHIKDGVQLSGSYFTPDAYSYSDANGWILVIARKTDALALYDTKNTTDKTLNGKNWKEPTQLKSVPLP